MKIIFKGTLNWISFKLPTHISYVLKKSFYLLSWKSLSCMKFKNWKIFPNEIQIFSKPFFIYLHGRSHIIFTPGFCVWNVFESMEIKMQNESLGKSFYSLSCNFQKFRIHSLSVNQSHNNQTNNQIYLFVYNIPKFRILGCYKPTTLKMNLVLEIRRG